MCENLISFLKLSGNTRGAKEDHISYNLKNTRGKFIFR